MATTEGAPAEEAEGNRDYKLTLEKTARLLGCLRPAVLVLNATVPVNWAPVEAVLLELGYCLIRLGRGDHLLEKRAARDYVAVLAEEEDYGRLQERVAALCDARYSYVYVFPNNQRAYRAWRKAETAAKVREELARNERCWREHLAALEGACFTLLV